MIALWLNYITRKCCNMMHNKEHLLPFCVFCPFLHPSFCSLIIFLSFAEVTFSLKAYLHNWINRVWVTCQSSVTYIFINDSGQKWIIWAGSKTAFPSLWPYLFLLKHWKKDDLTLGSQANTTYNFFTVLKAATCNSLYQLNSLGRTTKLSEIPTSGN